MTATRSRPALPGTSPSPNIWHHTATYEVENRAFDPDGLIDAAMCGAASWAGPHGPRPRLRHRLPPPALRGRPPRAVIGVEPHPALVALARRRTRRLPTSPCSTGTGQALPLPDASVDVVHARWAYFFGPGCEPGLAELDRVVRRGGTAFVIDNDAHPVDVRGLVPARLPEVDPAAVERFWAGRGWTRHAAC